MDKMGNLSDIPETWFIRSPHPKDIMKSTAKRRPIGSVDGAAVVAINIAATPIRPPPRVNFRPEGPSDRPFGFSWYVC
jgi:hypothetical protein